MEKLKMSPAELLKQVKVEPIEQEQLERVFKWMCK